jgi:hypothetical protein
LPGKYPTSRFKSFAVVWVIPRPAKFTGSVYEGGEGENISSEQPNTAGRSKLCLQKRGRIMGEI